MRRAFLDKLCCPCCHQRFDLASTAPNAGHDVVEDGILSSRCGKRFPVIAGVPRILPPDLASLLPSRFPEYFARHPELAPEADAARKDTLATASAFGDEWSRFPELMSVHAKIFEWYFDGPEPVRWQGQRVLDAGCGMGRWLHFAAEAGAEIVGMDGSFAIDVAAARDGLRADFVQADLRWPPFPPAAFDHVYSLGVVHHLEDPAAGVRSLAGLVRPGGALRLYVYRSLADEPRWRRALLSAVTLVRRLTTRLPYRALHVFCWVVAAIAWCGVIVPRRLVRHSALGDRLTRNLPLAQYADVPFRMLVAEQFDRFAAPLEGRVTLDEAARWVEAIGFDRVAILPDLGWRVIARRPAT